MTQDKEPRAQVMHKWEGGKLIPRGKMCRGLGHSSRQDQTLSSESRAGSEAGWGGLWASDSLWAKVGRRLLSGRGVSREKQRWEDSRQREEREEGGAWRGGRKLEGPERQPVFNLSWEGRASLLFLGSEIFRVRFTRHWCGGVSM